MHEGKASPAPVPTGEQRAGCCHPWADAAILGWMLLSRCSTGFSTMHPDAQELSSILASSGVATSPIFAVVAAENKEPGGPALLRHRIAICS